MKHTLLFLFPVLALASCSKSSSDPAPAASLVGTWALTSKTTVNTPKDGRAPTTYPQPVVPNTVKLTYSANGTYEAVFDKSVSATGVTEINSGNYTYSGNTVTYSRPGFTSSTAEVTVLTSAALTHVVTTEPLDHTYVSVTTSTYTR
ncbi:MAG: lipocalin family protein [Janthinobacterium lividum]